MPRWILVVVAAVICLSTTAHAAAQTPTFRQGTPYRTVKARLIANGFEPVQVTVDEHGWRCAPQGQECLPFPERLLGPSSAPYSDYLYRHRKTGRYWAVTASGGPRGSPDGGGPTFVRFFEIAPADFRLARIIDPRGREVFLSIMPGRK